MTNKLGGKKKIIVFHETDAKAKLFKTFVIKISPVGKMIKFNAVFSFQLHLNGTLLPTGEATFQHPAWTQSSGLGAASACDSFSRPCLLGPFLSEGQSSLCVSVPQFPPLPALRMHIFTTHTNTQRSVG